MRIIKILILIVIAVIFFKADLSAQSAVYPSDSIISKENFTKEKDTLSSKDVHPQDSPENSGLIVISNNKKFSMRLYGSARIYGSYDFNGLVGGTGFNISDIPVDPVNEDETFYMTANLTRLGIEVKRKTILGNTLIKIETDFNGTDSKFRIRQAYGQTNHFIVGQTWTNFSDIETLPLTVDSDGPPTAVTLRTVLIKYYLDFKPGWRFRASIESPSSVVFIPDTLSLETVTQNYPATGINLKKDWKAFQIKGAGILNPISVRNLSGERGSLLGRGALLSMNADFSSSSSFKFQGIYGNGIASFMNLAENSAFDVVLNPEVGEYELTTCYGGYVAYNQSLIKDFIDVDVVYGLVKLIMEDYFPDYSFNLGQYITLNAFIQSPEEFRLGVEYSYGYKKTKDGKHGNANRFAFSFYYDF
ncbi:MAG TPA: DcaP family trimeric outer membrane transporter [Ignavibacteria bacterium]|nr:DcaP family trimeric outer membrane transporter [Ignavibacteria bacterium]